MKSCFKAGAKVTTSKGVISIEQLRVNDKVLTHNNTFEDVDVQKIRGYVGNHNELTISGLCTTLGATEEHLVLSTIDGGNIGWNPIKDIKCGDFVSKSFYKGINDVSVVEITNYTDGSLYNNRGGSLESVVYEWGKPKENTPVKNNVTIDKTFMKFLGYLLSIGFIASGVGAVSFTIGEQENKIIDDIRDVIGKVFDVPLEVNDMENGFVTVVIKNNVIALFLEEFLRTDKEFVYALPPFLEEVNPDIQIGFLESIFKTTGNYAGDRVEVNLNNYFVIQQMYAIALRNGLSPYVYRTNDNWFKEYSFSLPKNGELEKPFIEEALGSVVSIGDIGKDTAYGYDSKWVDDETYGKKYMLAIIDNEVTKIKGSVYNIEVKNAHSYSVAGIDVHNCH